MGPEINPTKSNDDIAKIVTPVELIKKGDKLDSSEAALLTKFRIKPLSCRLAILSVYDNGSVLSPEVFNLTEDDLVDKFAAGVSMVASLSFALSYPTLAIMPHMFVNAYKNVIAVAVDIEYTFPQAKRVKEYLKDPSKFAVVVISVLSTENAAAPASKEEEKKDEPVDESDDDLGFSWFD
ncbi:60S acidic ribosomal protein P0-like [Asparagus officinalis]|uniref:60S acidic ribosomal protein P0-like n=1 Tax=Asparagus officinalis TaxID=4686 RepID=UPI00098E087E|nr:60S acidic ribosomal protein P0-like [Asparagus officinalis]